MDRLEAYPTQQTINQTTTARGTVSVHNESNGGRPFFMRQSCHPCQGIISMTTVYTNGPAALIATASANRPWLRWINERVIPQPGQGMPVSRRVRHDSGMGNEAPGKTTWPQSLTVIIADMVSTITAPKQAIP